MKNSVPGDFFEAVVFDMDGVLVDAREWHFEALNKSLQIMGVSISREDHEGRYNGLPTRTKLSMLTEELGLPKSSHQLIERLKQRYTLQLAAQFATPNLEHLKILRGLRSSGFRIAVATNSIRATSSFFLQLVGVAPYLDALITNEDVQNPKPSPDIYTRAAEVLETPCNRILVVEDSAYGILAARRAGCAVLEVSGVEEVTMQAIERSLAVST